MKYLQSGEAFKKNLSANETKLRKISKNIEEAIKLDKYIANAGAIKLHTCGTHDPLTIMLQYINCAIFPFFRPKCSINCIYCIMWLLCMENDSDQFCHFHSKTCVPSTNGH